MSAHDFFFIALMVMAGIMSIFLFVSIKRPNIFDKLLGLNGIATKSIILLLLVGTYFEDLDMFVDISLGYGLINLVGSLAIGKYLERRGVEL